MVDRECNLLVQHLKRMVEERGNIWEKFIDSKEYPEIYKGKKAEASQRVLTSLVLGAVVRDESMTVTDEEASPYIVELLSRYNLPVERIKQDEQARRAFEQLSRQAKEEALTKKVVDFLLAQTEINFVPEVNESSEPGTEEPEKAPENSQAENQ